MSQVFVSSIPTSVNQCIEPSVFPLKVENKLFPLYLKEFGQSPPGLSFSGKQMIIPQIATLDKSQLDNIILSIDSLKDLEWCTFMGIHHVIAPFPISKSTQIQFPKNINIFFKCTLQQILECVPVELLSKSSPGLCLQLDEQSLRIFDAFSILGLGIQMIDCSQISIQSHNMQLQYISKLIHCHFIVRRDQISNCLQIINPKNPLTVIPYSIDSIHQFWKYWLLIQTRQKIDKAFSLKQKKCPQNKGSNKSLMKLGIFDDLPLPPVSPSSDICSFLTYQGFEYDLVKYEKYHQALVEGVHFSMKKWPQTCLNFCIAGCGRGPLMLDLIGILCSIKSKNVKFQCTLVAIDHNPFVVQIASSLVNFQKTPWVKVVSANCLSCHFKQKFHMIASELLGSFGCNECCPEILSLFYSNNLVSGGISIPQQFDTYFSLVTSQPSFRASTQTLSVCRFLDYQFVPGLNKVSDSDVDSRIGISTKFGVYTALSHAFSFKHPYPKSSLNQKIHVNFPKISSNTIVHGLYLTFTACLFDSIYLNFCPDSPLYYDISTSWFPAFFSFPTAIVLEKHVAYSLTFTRKSSNSKLIYQCDFYRCGSNPVLLFSVACDPIEYVDSEREDFDLFCDFT